MNETEKEILKEAMFYQKLESEKIKCQLCPRQCLINESGRGFCRVRENRKGKLYSLVYGRPCSADIGPIEKAPLYHFIPGHRRLCVATVGCNLSCKYCHNWHISQASPGQHRELDLSPRQVVNRAEGLGVDSISFTYTEPTIFYEYMYDISRIAKEKNLKTSAVSNGYINSGPLKKLISVLDAIKIDLKSFSDIFYQDISGGARLEPVLNTLGILKQEGIHFEIVNLVVPTLNDSVDEIKKMCFWVKDNLGANVPLHFSRFSPSYKLTRLPSTPVKTLEKAIKIATEAGLKYVYIGNVAGYRNNSTFCAKCGTKLIHRIHFSVRTNEIKNSKCRFCQHPIPGIY